MGGAISAEGTAGLSGAALGEAVAVAVHLENVDVVGDAIKQSAGQALGSERFRPFVKRKISGNQGGTPFVTLRDQFELIRWGGCRSTHLMGLSQTSSEAAAIP